MTTSAQAAQITEVPLITVRTVKRKHLKPLWERNSSYTKWPEPEPKMIGYIEEWSSILIQTQDGKIDVIRNYIYTEHVDNLRLNEGKTRGEGNKEAWATINALPQLFLD